MRFNEKLTEADYDDYYSVANLTLYKAFVSYNPETGVCFDAYLYSCLQNKLKSELKHRHSMNSILNRSSVSLDGTKADGDEYNLLDVIPSDFDTFDEVMKQQDKEQYRDKVQEYISKLSNQQTSILNLLIDGFKPKEIRQILNISAKEYSDNLAIMRAYENVKVLF
jgi:RNA polymerase sigma factor (sigma-70 family)